MTINEYDQVRSQDDRFVVYPGHETETLEWVVARTDRFVIVDKRPAAEPLVPMTRAMPRRADSEDRIDEPETKRCGGRAGRVILAAGRRRRGLWSELLLVLLDQRLDRL